MRLPRADEAIIPAAKVNGYLLSQTHRSGRAKAAFFLAFGFRAAQWELFATALRAHAQANRIVSTEDTPFGQHVVVEGPLHSPDGRSPIIRVVWFLASPTETPRLVTAYPRKGARR